MFWTRCFDSPNEKKEIQLSLNDLQLKNKNEAAYKELYTFPNEFASLTIRYIQGPVVRKQINLIQDLRKLWFHVFNFLWWNFLLLMFFFSRLTSSNVKFYRISALNSIWE